MRRSATTTIALAWGLALLSAAARTAAADVYVGFQSDQIAVAPGDTFSVYVMIPQSGASFNAFDLSLRFDPGMLSFDPISPVADQRGSLMTSACSNTFHQFSAAPDSVKATLSLLCSNTFVTGPGMIYHVRFRAGSAVGPTTISFGPFTEFYAAGLFVRPQHQQQLVVNVGSPTGVAPDPGTGERLELAPPAPNPGHGSVLLEFALPAPDRVRFDLLDAQGRRITGKDAAWYQAGRHRVAWSPPALPGGLYFIELRTDSGASLARRWTVLRGGW